MVAASVWADAGDLINAVTKGQVFPIKHPDTMSEEELQVVYVYVCVSKSVRLYLPTY